MKQYVGNCGDVIDWNAVVESVANLNPYGNDLATHKATTIHFWYKRTREAWDKAGYTLAPEGGTVGWDMHIRN